MGVLLLPSTRCRCRQQKQLGFLWSDMIVKQLITSSSSSSSSAASIQLGQLQDNNISRPLHRSSLEVIMKRVVGIVRIGSAGQLWSFTSAFLTKVLHFLKCEMQFPPFFFFGEFHFPSPASLSCWIYEMLSNAKKGIPHSGLWETDFKYRLCCGSLFKLFFSLMSSLINKTARHPATCESLVCVLSVCANRILLDLIFFFFSALLRPQIWINRTNCTNDHMLLKWWDKTWREPLVECDGFF